jgi:glucose/arabinose dehydrogenase
MSIISAEPLYSPRPRRRWLAPVIFYLSALAVPATGYGLSFHNEDLSIDGDRYTLSIPDGYRLEWLTKLDAPRLMTFLANGDLLIGSKSGKVYRLVPPYTRPEVLVSLDGYPHSLAWRDGTLYIARTDGLYRTPYRLGQARIDADAVTLVAPLPTGGHSSRTVGIGPDGRIYVSLGISGNCSDEYLGEDYAFEDRRGGVLVLNESQGKPYFETFASGLRNPVGFDWQPLSGELYASNNGPDHLGYEQPPEYFSRLTPGSFHGMPWFQYNGRSIRRDNCIRRSPPRPVTEVVKPVATFPARNAPLGVAFVPQGALDPGLEGHAIVALHGSWGTRPRGGFAGDPATRRPPRLMLVRFEDGAARDVIDFVRGFQQPNGERLARPAGVAIGPAGALYFTSDGGKLEGLFRLRRSPDTGADPQQPRGE